MIRKWIVNPVGVRCNMRCGYCHCGFVYGDGTSTRRRMSFEVLRQLVRRTREAEPPEVYLHWHGGEPTLAGLDFYETLFALQRRILPSHARIYNSMTTNGLLLDEDWIAAFERTNFTVVVSLDGPSYRHNKHRCRSRSEFDRVLKSVHVLRERKVPVEISLVVSDANCREARRICGACTDLGVEQLRLLPCRHVDAQGRLSTISVRPEQYGRFLVELFEAWLHAGKPFRVAPFAIVFRGIATGQFDACYMLGCCTTVHVEADGQVYGSCLVTHDGTRLGSVCSDTVQDLERRLEEMTSSSAEPEHVRSIILDGDSEDRFDPGTTPESVCPYRDPTTSMYAYLSSFRILTGHVLKLLEEKTEL